MIQVFMGYRNVMRHVLFVAPPGEPQIVERFCPEVEQWCKENLTGPAYPTYEVFEKIDEKTGKMGTFARWEFVFHNERDAALFKLFHIGG